MDYRTYGVSRRDREPLLRFVIEALSEQGCRILKASDPDVAPFRISFETPAGERMGVVCYAFLANQKLTRNRPADERRFQVKYGEKDGKLHRIWQDPYGLYTTLFVGIDPEAGLFVGVDPEMHNPTRFFISVEFKEAHAEAILKAGWHAWEREKRKQDAFAEPVEVLVGGKKSRLLDYVRFERAAHRLDQGHRQLLAEKMAAGPLAEMKVLPGPTPIPEPAAVHELAREFEMTTDQVLDLIASARRLKMAVRGWVAEEHLVRTLTKVEGVSDCKRLDEEGGPDVSLSFKGSRLVTIQCKNVLRNTLADGTVRLDFQKTRGSKDDPCTRYYRPSEFDLVAACLHAITERWEFKYALPGSLDKHAKCPGRLSQTVRLDTRWTAEAGAMLQAASRA